MHADTGDAVAHQAVVRGDEYLRVGLGSLANAMNPGVIVVGDGVLGAGPRWFDAVLQTVPDRVRHTIVVGSDGVPAVIGAGLMGLVVVSHDIGYRGWGEWDEGLARYGAGY